MTSAIVSHPKVGGQFTVRQDPNDPVKVGNTFTVSWSDTKTGESFVRTGCPVIEADESYYTVEVV